MFYAKVFSLKFVMCLQKDNMFEFVLTNVSIVGFFSPETATEMEYVAMWMYCHVKNVGMDVFCIKTSSLCGCKKGVTYLQKCAFLSAHARRRLSRLTPRPGAAPVQLQRASSQGQRR